MSRVSRSDCVDFLPSIDTEQRVVKDDGLILLDDHHSKSVEIADSTGFLDELNFSIDGRMLEQNATKTKEEKKEEKQREKEEKKKEKEEEKRQKEEEKKREKEEKQKQKEEEKKQKEEEKKKKKEEEKQKKSNSTIIL